MALGIVEGAELRWGLPQAGVGSEDAATALTLVADLDAKNAVVSTIIFPLYLYDFANWFLPSVARRNRWFGAESGRRIRKLRE
jgi:hypothetical protein